VAIPRESLNKSQNISMVQSISNAYGQQQLLQSSRPKKTSLSFLRKSNITAAGAGQSNNTPQKNNQNALNLSKQRISQAT